MTTERAWGQRKLYPEEGELGQPEPGTPEAELEEAVILPEEYVIKDGYAEADTTLDSADSDTAADESVQEEGLQD